MQGNLEQFIESLRGKRIIFVGIGVTNTGVIAQFARAGLDVTACDRRDPGELGDALNGLKELGVTLLLGKDYPPHFEGDVLFRTPGMYFYRQELQAFRGRGGVVTSEMEVFCDLCPCPVIAVTGSDGKTTTSTVIAEMLRAAGRTVHLGGNIGRALLPEIPNITPEDIAVVELSSFQLISMRCAPQVSVVTNIEPNHLDVHADMEEYIAAKRNIFTHQNAFSTTVLSADNELTASFTGEVRGICRTFSLHGPVHNGAYLGCDGVLRLSRWGEEVRLFDAADIKLPGMHNVSNYLTAACAVDGLVSPEAMQRVAREFGGVEHRIELVRTLDGVRWFNDSIATSPTRALAGLRSFDQKIILIAGGYDKNLSYEPLAPELIERVKLLILTGDTADKIQSALIDCFGYQGSPRILRAADMDEAVAMAHRSAVAGDVVSLSPASASFDRYPNFEVRGRHFKELVHALPQSGQ